MSDTAANDSGPDELGRAPNEIGPDAVAPGRFCVKCLYPLATLDPRGNCPECGTPIAESCAAPTAESCAAPLLTSSDFYFVRSLCQGSTVVGVGAWMYAAFWAIGLIPIGFGVGSFAAALYLLRPFMIAAALVVILGLRTLASPDPMADATREDRSGRNELRQFATSCAILAAVEGGLWFLSLVMMLSDESAGIVGVLLVCVPVVRHFFTVGLLSRVFPYVASIAVRLPDVRLYERARLAERSLAVTGMIVLFAFPLGMLIPAMWSVSLTSRIRRAARAILAQQTSGEPPG